MPSLAEVLSEMRSRIEKHRGRGINEQNTKSTLIDPVLRALGWDLEDLEIVQREYKARKRDNPVDYALFSGREPVLFIEAKSLGQDLSDRKWAGQVVGYASVAGAPWVLLTNGDEYRIFNAHAPVPVDRKLFRTVRVSGPDGDVAQILALLQRERMKESGLDSLWKSHFVDQEVRSAIEELFGTGAPDISLVNLVRRKTKNLTARNVKESLARVRVDLDFPLETTKQVADRLLPARQLQSVATLGRKKTQIRSDVKVADLIAAGLIEPPLALSKSYKGKEFTAQIEADGSITFQGRSYASVSEPAAAARKSIIGAPKGQTYPATNGWMFWRFEDADGTRKDLAELRERYLRKSRLKAVG